VSRSPPRTRRGCAAIRLQGLSDRDRPKLAVRTGIDAGKLVLATDAPYVASPQTGDTRTTADDLFDLLSKLLPAQFEAVLFRAKVPTEYLPAATVPQIERAIATIRYFELQRRLDHLARTVQQVVTGGGVGTDPRSAHGRGPRRPLRWVVVTSGPGMGKSALLAARGTPPFKVGTVVAIAAGSPRARRSSTRDELVVRMRSREVVRRPTIRKMHPR
jgi:hypothetical protein